MEVLSIEGVKNIDYYTINEIGIPSIVLMENAGHEIFSAILHKGKKFIIFCGTGNNGGDGLVIARKLIMKSKDVQVVICGNVNKCTNEFKINYEILKNIQAEILEVIEEKDINEKIISLIKDSDIIVDAIFGVGLNKDIYGVNEKIINCINMYGRYIVSVDIPSGIQGDTGKIKGVSVKANETYTIEVYKRGFFQGKAMEYLGDLNIINIGFPEKIIKKYSERINVLGFHEYKNIIPKRNKMDHKGDFGRVLILAGSEGLTGAAYITTESAVRTGAGLVYLLVNKEIQGVLANRMTEAMVINYEYKGLEELIKKANVIACGPGIGNSEESIAMFIKILEESICPLVLDADALNILSNKRELFKHLKGRSVVTPHPGEMSRLLNKEIIEIEDNRIEEAINFSKEKDLVTVLKGYNTIISDGNKTFINMTGNSKMASGGMGDCLTGIITAFIAQGVSIREAALLGVYIHGYIGDILGKERYIVNSRDIIEMLPKIIQQIIKN